MAHGGGFAGGAAWYETVDTGFDLPFDELPIGLFIHPAVLERGYKSGKGSGKFHASSNGLTGSLGIDIGTLMCR